MLKWQIFGLTGCLLTLFCVANSLKSSDSEPRPNILLICVDDLRPELNSFGAGYMHSPNIDQLVQEGFSFTNHFVNAPSCGPSRYTLLTGLYGPSENYALFKRAKKINDAESTVPPSMPEWFRKQGYFTVSVGKISHHPGGRGGADWNDSTQLEMPNAWNRNLMPVSKWKHPRGAMHGLAHGEIRLKKPKMDVFQSVEGNDLIYPDGSITLEALNQMNKLSKDQETPFFLAVGLLKPHLPFGAPKSYYDLYQGKELPDIPHPEKPIGKTTWHASGEFKQYNTWGKNPNMDAAFADEVRRHYAACVSYADAQVGKILDALKKSGLSNNTIVVLWGDHGWHLGEHAVWGKHTLFDEALRAPLIIKYPNMDHKGSKSDLIVQTLDIFPTLCALTGIEQPEFIQGESLVGIMNKVESTDHLAVAYHKKAKTIRTPKYRLILHQDGFVELYDHSSAHGETRNVATEHPELVARLKKTLLTKLR